MRYETWAFTTIPNFISLFPFRMFLRLGSKLFVVTQDECDTADIEQALDQQHGRRCFEMYIEQPYAVGKHADEPGTQSIAKERSEAGQQCVKRQVICLVSFGRVDKGEICPAEVKTYAYKSLDKNGDGINKHVISRGDECHQDHSRDMHHGAVGKGAEPGEFVHAGAPEWREKKAHSCE